MIRTDVIRQRLLENRPDLNGTGTPWKDWADDMEHLLIENARLREQLIQAARQPAPKKRGRPRREQ